jgi:hypothetical protein
VKKLKVIHEAKEEFWDRWGKEVFPVLLMLPKSTKYKWNIQIGDVELRSNKIAAGQTHKNSTPKSWNTSCVRQEGLISGADMEYRLPKEEKF